MRNIFDQYHQAENKLTHALVSTLCSDVKLSRHFCTWCTGRNVKSSDTLKIEQQTVPGSDPLYNSQTTDKKGLPDASIIINENRDSPWVLLIENKIGSKLTRDQLKRHRKTTARFFYDIEVLAITATAQTSSTLDDAHHKTWKEVFEWFGKQKKQGFWIQQFREFMHILESQMLDDNKHLPEFLTMFDGIHISEQQPYSYQSAKLLLRNLTNELRHIKKLESIGVDLKDTGRHAITRGKLQHVWDYLTLKPKNINDGFTDWPHFTAAIHIEQTSIRLTIPNNMRAYLKNNLRSLSPAEFSALLQETFSNFRACLPKSNNWQPTIHLIQRHFKSQRSVGIIDGEVDADLRTIKGDKKNGVKINPYWINGIFESWKNSRGSNVQMQIGVQFPHNAELLKGKSAVKILSDCMLAMKPVIAQLGIIR